MEWGWGLWDEGDEDEEGEGSEVEWDAADDSVWLGDVWRPSGAWWDVMVVWSVVMEAGWGVDEEGEELGGVRQ